MSEKPLTDEEYKAMNKILHALNPLTDVRRAYILGVVAERLGCDHERIALKGESDA